MQTRRRLVSATLLLASLLTCSCGKKPAQTATAQSPDNQNSATQTVANGITPDSSGSKTAPVPSTNASAANTSDASSQPPAEVEIPAGVPITVRLQQGLSSASAVPGERFEAVLDEPIVLHDRTVVPAGSLVAGHVVSARRSGRLHHPGELALTLDTLLVGQENIPLLTTNVVAFGASHKKRNWAWIGGGSGGGALIGALAAGGRGALIGTGIGAVAGTTTAFVTGKKDVSFASERRLRFRLNREVNVPG
jgi:hypothetical protein